MGTGGTCTGSCGAAMLALACEGTGTCTGSNGAAMLALACVEGIGTGGSGTGSGGTAVLALTWGGMGTGGTGAGSGGAAITSSAKLGSSIKAISLRKSGNRGETTLHDASNKRVPCCGEDIWLNVGSMEMTKSKFFKDCRSGSPARLDAEVASLTRTCSNRKKRAGKPSGEDVCQSGKCVNTTRQSNCAALACRAATSSAHGTSPLAVRVCACNNGNKTCSRHSFQPEKGSCSQGNESSVPRSSKRRCNETKACAEDF
mmetsp:Transcript_25349/g.40644  ORF Transcript_25349/g.40644 Transcript_25349/m.40644 type:complete len:258 (-) Transcript_25349:1494-2267(-)